MTDFSVRAPDRDSGATVLVLEGELDLAGAPVMRAAGLAALDDPDCAHLVLDTAALTFIDSTGVGSWVELRNHAEQRTQTMTLRAMPPNIARVLAIAGLTTLFLIDDGPAPETLATS